MKAKRKVLHRARARAKRWMAARNRANRDTARGAVSERGKRLKIGNTHPHYIVGIHWLSVAYERICAGESEIEVLRDFGYEYTLSRRAVKWRRSSPRAPMPCVIHEALSVEERSMTDSFGKRRWAGEPHVDKRRGKAPDVERLPPHKKPRTYRLMVRIETTSVRTMWKEFPSKIAMQEHRGRVERSLAQAKAEEKLPRRRFRRYWFSSYDLKMDESECETTKGEPVITEEMIEGSPPS